MKKTSQKFKGPIAYVSLSPHGDPEGVVLKDGSFIKAPPHSVLKPELFQSGAEVSGEGELLVETPNPVYHHARILSGGVVISDDSGAKHEREALKEKHKKDKKNRKEAPEQSITLKGKLVAIATKPKGEVDRFIFEDGTSVHLPKEIEIESDACAIGSIFEVTGKARTYKRGRFLKADSVSENL